ncbi:MAG: hypothetical protein ACRDI0_02500 [Actinomycetota bacterium]
MDNVDLTTLATSICAGLDGVRVCLLLSGDGLTLGAHPPDGEGRAREVWGRLQGIGDPVRGFMDIGEEVWVVLRRGPYTGVLVTGPGVKAGLLLDKLEFMLRTAEEARARDATAVATPPSRPEATRRPRTSLHAEANGDAPPPSPEQGTKPARDGRGPTSAPRYTAPEVLQGAAKRVVDITAAGGDPEPEPDAPSAPPRDPRGNRRSAADDGEVDRVALAREFRQLLGESDVG